MKKISFAVIASIVLLAGMAYAEDYCFLKMSDGQKIHITDTRYYLCEHTTCTVCVDENLWYASYVKCGKNCEISAPEEPLTFDAVFPFLDNGVYNKSNFFLQAYTNKIVAMYLVDNVAGTQSVLCPNCMSYKRSRTFKQGFNDITIRAIKGLEIQEERITFTIDTKKPRISRVLPVSNKFVSSEFTVVYTEDNLQEIKVNYGNSESGFKEAILEGCESGRNKNCSIELNLGEYDGEDITYYFSIKDIAGNIVSSRVTKVKVDETAPVINTFSYFVSGRYITFNMSITEQNLYRVEYTDFNDIRPRAKLLCSSLRYGTCYKRVLFRGTSPDLLIKVSDKAGNSAEESIVSAD